MSLDEKFEAWCGYGKQNSMVTVHSVTGQIRFNPEFYVMKHFSHFVSAGARRLKIADPEKNKAVAFVNPNGEIIVVCMNNTALPGNWHFKMAGHSLQVEAPAPSLNTFRVTPQPGGRMKD